MCDSAPRLGLTSFAYRYEGLRRSDFDEAQQDVERIVCVQVMSALADRLENEGGGSQLERPTALRQRLRMAGNHLLNGAYDEKDAVSGWKAWVEEAGAVFCVKQREMDERQTEDGCFETLVATLSWLESRKAEALRLFGCHG